MEDEKLNIPEGWTNPPTLLKLKSDLEGAKESHDVQCALIRNWLDYLNITGSVKRPKSTTSSNIQPKLIRKQAEWRYPSLSEPFLSAENVFSIEPVTFEDVEAARQNGLVLNHQFNTKIDKVAFIDAAVRNLTNEGTAIIQLGWDSQEEEVTELKPIVEFTVNPEVSPLLQELEDIQREDPNKYNSEVPDELKQAHAYSIQEGIPYEATIVGMEEVIVIKSVQNAPTVELREYQNVIVDPSCKGELSKARFIVNRFETSLAELQEVEDRYFNLDVINLNTNTPVEDNEGSDINPSNFNFSDNARKRIVAYEYWGYWDVKNTDDVVPIITTWVGDTIIRMEENPFPDKGLPFVFIPLLPVKNSIYGEPDGELLKDNQDIIGAVSRGMIDVMGKSANGQRGFRKDALDATNKRKFKTGRDYEYNGNVDPRMAFHTHTYPEIPQSANYMINLQNAEAESMTGVKAFNAGISGDALGSVATGVRGALDAAGRRETGIVRRLANGLAIVGKKIISMNSEFLDDTEIVRITNESFVAIQRDALAGNFDLTVAITSIQEDEAKAQELSFILQTMGNTVEQEISMKVLRDIARLRKMPELAKELDNWQPTPDPMQQQIQQLEIQKLQKEIAELDSKARENMAEAALDMAKANNINSDTDLKNLNYVEQESGVHQEREKELRSVQGQANEALEITKHHLQDKGAGVTSKLQEYINTK